MGRFGFMLGSCAGPDHVRSSSGAVRHVDDLALTDPGRDVVLKWCAKVRDVRVCRVHKFMRLECACAAGSAAEWSGRGVCTVRECGARRVVGTP